MTVVFYEGRRAPVGLRHMNGYGGDTFTEAGAVAFTKAISPWDFLTGVFVTKPAAEAANQAAIAQSQAQEAGIVAQGKAEMIRTAMMVGGGVLGIVVLVSLLRRPAPARVGGYRKSRRKNRRSH